MQKSVKNTRLLDARGTRGCWLILPVCLLLAGLTSQAQISLNVADYGAVGDAAQIWVNTVSNSPSITCSSNIFSSTDVGKTIELFGVGNVNIGNNVNNVRTTNCQDFIGIITNYVNATNVQAESIIGEFSQATSNGVYCIYGTQNVPAFQAAVNAASGTNTIINIPAGNYLLIPPMQYTNYNSGTLNWIPLDAGIILNKGGLHFVGATRDTTTLIADGAFKFQGSRYNRGMIFLVNGPITNDYPLIWDSLTFDGGLQAGLSGAQGDQYNNTVDGLGWDGSSAAGADMGSEPLNTFKEFVNCKFQHFRGEIIKGITGSAGNETILVTNCVFTDGNATAFNYNFAHTITDCIFSNMYQIEEFYLKYPTNAPSYFINNFCTNIQHGFIALNGGTYTNEPYIISNNVFCQLYGNGIATTPATSVFIISNQFICAAGGYAINIVLGEAGYQGFSDNSNIVIAANSFTGEPAMILEIAGGTSSTDPNRVEDVRVHNNSIVRNDGTPIFLTTYDWSTNIYIYSNYFNTLSGADYSTFNSGSYGSPYALVDVNNNYYSAISTPGTNYISYANGSKFEVINSAGTAYALVNTDASQIPSGAQMVIYNNTYSSASIPVYLNNAFTGSPVMVTNGGVFTSYWNGRRWELHLPSPPANIRQN